MIIEGTFSEDSLTPIELDKLTEQLKDLAKQQAAVQSAFERGVEVGRRLAEYQELPY